MLHEFGKIDCNLGVIIIVEAAIKEVKDYFYSKFGHHNIHLAG